MSRSIHETLRQLQKENPTRGEIDSLTADGPTLSRLHKKAKIKKDVRDKRSFKKILQKLKITYYSK